MALDKRLKIKSKNQLDSDVYSKRGFEFGAFLARMQGIDEQFLGASSAAITSNASALTSLKLGSMNCKYIAHDAAAKPAFSNSGMQVTTAAANNDGSICYTLQDFALPTGNDKIIFEAMFGSTTVANCDQVVFGISNESAAALAADTDILSSDTLIAVNIDNGNVKIASNEDAGTLVQVDTGLDAADGEFIHVKIEISSDKKADVYVNGKYSKLDVMTFDAGDTLRIVFGALVDATAAAGDILLKQIAVYKLIA